MNPFNPPPAPTAESTAFRCSPIGPMLPDYWPGDYRPHIQIPVYKGMTLGQLHQDAVWELELGSIQGTCGMALLLDAPEGDKWRNMAREAILRDIQTLPGCTELFTDLEEGEDLDSVYLYLVFTDYKPE